MGPAATTALGAVAGFVLFLAMAFTGVIAVNGASNPGLTPVQPSAGAGSTGEAYAVDSGPPSVRSLDLNSDGALSISEVAGYPEIVGRFERADRDRDGRLTQAEFDRLGKVRPSKSVNASAVKRSVRRDAAIAAAGG
jgi:EF hand